MKNNFNFLLKIAGILEDVKNKPLTPTGLTNLKTRATNNISKLYNVAEEELTIIKLSKDDAQRLLHVIDLTGVAVTKMETMVKKKIFPCRAEFDSLITNRKELSSLYKLLTKCLK